MWGMPPSGLPAPTRREVAGTDAHSALGDFDGIWYAKGASVLRQLIAHIGDEAFLAGVVEHLSSHRFGNGELAEFLEAMEGASGRSLEAWSAAWLETSGADRLALEDGVLTRTTPAAHPADRRTRSTSRRSPGGAEVAPGRGRRRG